MQEAIVELSQEVATRSGFWVGASAALLSLVAYGWALRLPFIADDYLQITLGRQYGPPGSWAALLADPALPLPGDFHRADLVDRAVGGP